ncbi:cytochrome d ubiquinol oxidase subunit II [Arthrobacter crystallopoietes]|uniref:Cytochrome bd-I ubiquinol oxidase subunit 2 apoprotein n=1 Tax=Crystallibacter crystallopoietes TaxID=37928 RepID=A0A1H1GW10_9MICC|nr:cytochrome d ubiquinol oxidase subunit II [Arthrobacter crystallopoietes]AUI52322.1 cytochrome d ubiquinol oxidase subunit II [Arthrobacter crystallopoietes]SDR17341.1 cytochrome bd-I ubiquinol oxidase subunit 2 apoprotein [Arthrobacter crystallopoietes]
METLPTLWFIIIAFFWTGYLFLEGFDLGVGMLMRGFARNNTERRVLLNTVGPVWDGNEVWLVTAGAATFAAFPDWYASLFSALYLPLVIVLLALIFRAVAFEYRGKMDSDRWRSVWDWAIVLGSFVAAFGVGAMLALTTTGLPLNENGDRVGGPFAWFNGYAVLGGLAVVFFCLVHAAAFLALKTDGDIRVRARKLLLRWLPVALLPLALWAIAVVVAGGKSVTYVTLLVAVLGAVFAWMMARRERDGWSFGGLGVFLLAGTATIFTAVFPNVLPSTIDSAYNLTVTSASSSDYTLGVMSVIAAFGIPAVLVYQGYTYWVFRKRVSASSIPAAHAVVPQ